MLCRIPGVARRSVKSINLVERKQSRVSDRRYGGDARTADTADFLLWSGDRMPGMTAVIPESDICARQDEHGQQLRDVARDASAADAFITLW